MQTFLDIIAKHKDPDLTAPLGTVRSESGVFSQTKSSKHLRSLWLSSFVFRFRQHKTDFEKIPSDRPILLPCKVKGCGCRSYHYVPQNGTQPIRCTCKHYSEDHTAVVPHKCKTGKFHYQRNQAEKKSVCGFKTRSGTKWPVQQRLQILKIKIILKKKTALEVLNYCNS